MRPATSLLQLALCLSSVTPMVSAWPSFLPDIDSLVVRADKEAAAPAAGATDASAPATASTPPASQTSSPSQPPKSVNLNTAQPKKTGTGTDDSKETGTGTGTESGKHTATGTATDDGDDDSDPEETHTTFNPVDPAAGVQMNTPATNLPIGTALFKIGDYVTFGWNYTSMQGTPTAIDVLVTCSTSSSLWTLTQNMTFQTSAAYVWDTEKQMGDTESPLLTALYTLIIKDSDASISQRPEPGYLGAFTGFTFGLYAKQSYVPYPDWHCLDCNSAPGKLDSSAARLAVTMCVLTVFSFTWFVAGLGLN
ncbi:hypothetical protein PT974_10267 [Cladobotryum mycophilum]|uniref:DUF7137 domain-containing protein n=1 Tax=Cladobotryum mycophilum TaxID=491253 RepID=A0ABR0S9D7_9HYPO